MGQATQLLHAVGQGNGKAAEELLPLVHKERRRLAAHKMAIEVPGQPLQPTALAHEAWLRLVGNKEHLRVSVATAERLWACARVWLFQEIEKGRASPV